MREDWPGMIDDPGGVSARGRIRPEPPRFCPGCRRPRASHSDLCPECGDRLETQGYCTVCEGFWPLSAGNPCPKHELELISEPPEPVHTVADGERIDWVTVQTFPLPFQAEAARLRLDAEAIPTLLDGYRMGTNTAYHVATGGIRLQVPRAFQQDARVILSQSWSVPADDEDDEDDWDEPAHEAAPPTDWRTPIVFWGVVLSLLVVVAGLIGLIR